MRVDEPDALFFPRQAYSSPCVHCTPNEGRMEMTESAPQAGAGSRPVHHLPNASDGSAESSGGAKSPLRRRGQAAAAIMAALSVERARVGNATRMPRRAASAVKRARSSRLAATPPVIKMRRVPRDSAAAKV